MTTAFRLSCPLALAVLLSSVVAAQPQKPPTSRVPSGTTGTSGTNGTRAADADADYRLVPGDKLRIEVYKDAQLSQSLQVRPDGKITLPLVGDVPAAGRTSNELRDTIASSLTEYIANPVVTVIVVETVPPVYYVVGEVNSPGPQPLTGQISVLQALSAAGGFRDFAKTKDIRIQRKTPTGMTTLRFNYKDAINGEQKPIFLQPGDTIIVP
ncbi:MAG TPA: polysaccharide biosynthesis/export family protein [Vicinamibacterales bacterium]